MREHKTERSWYPIDKIFHKVSNVVATSSDNIRVCLIAQDPSVIAFKYKKHVQAWQYLQKRNLIRKSDHFDTDIYPMKTILLQWIYLKI